MSNRLSPPAMDPASLVPGAPAAATRSSIGKRSKNATSACSVTHSGSAASASTWWSSQPGAWSAQRHWHSAEDEFVYVVSGEVTLITDSGRQLLGPGMVAGFPAGKADGHHLVNASGETAVYLEVGDRDAKRRGALSGYRYSADRRPRWPRRFATTTGDPTMRTDSSGAMLRGHGVDTVFGLCGDAGGFPR